MLSVACSFSGILASQRLCFLSVYCYILPLHHLWSPEVSSLHLGTLFPCPDGPLPLCAPPYGCLLCSIQLNRCLLALCGPMVGLILQWPSAHTPCLAMHLVLQCLGCCSSGSSASPADPMPAVHCSNRKLARRHATQSLWAKDYSSMTNLACGRATTCGC